MGTISPKLESVSDTLARVQGLTEATFPGARTELKVSPHSERVSGFIFWDGFDGETPVERQRRVWDMLQQNLSLAEQRQVTSLFTLTPAEEQSLREDF